jgi:hypothetical protein
VRQHCFCAHACERCISTGPVIRLQLARLDDGRALAVLDVAAAGASGLESLDDVQALVVSDLAEDDVATIEPRGDNGGDEELGAVGVGASVGHGQQTGLVVLQLEVLIGKLLAVDGLAAGTVTAGEVTTLEHEVGDDSVERRALVAKALLAGAESTEVLSGLGDNIIEEVEGDAARLLLNGAGGLAVLHDGTLPLNVEEDLVTHGCGCC